MDKSFNFNFKGVKLSVHKKEYAKIEKQNNISISVFGYEDKTPYPIYISKQFLKKFWFTTIMEL